MGSLFERLAALPVQVEAYRLERCELPLGRFVRVSTTTRDIALQLLVERALDSSDRRLLRLMTKRVGVALRGQRDKAVVRSDQGPGQYMIWGLRARLRQGLCRTAEIFAAPV